MTDNQDKSAVRQFLPSLLQYAESNQFSPDNALDVELIKELLNPE